MQGFGIPVWTVPYIAVSLPFWLCSAPHSAAAVRMGLAAGLTGTCSSSCRWLRPHERLLLAAFSCCTSSLLPHMPAQLPSSVCLSWLSRQLMHGVMHLCFSHLKRQPQETCMCRQARAMRHRAWSTPAMGGWSEPFTDSRWSTKMAQGTTSQRAGGEIRAR